MEPMHKAHVDDIINEKLMKGNANKTMLYQWAKRFLNSRLVLLHFMAVMYIFHFVIVFIIE